jgi:hypothetical protein
LNLAAEYGWLPAAACCVILLIAWLTFMLTGSIAIPKAFIWLRFHLNSLPQWMRLFRTREVTDRLA